MCRKRGAGGQGENYHCLNTPGEKHCARDAASFHFFICTLGSGRAWGLHCQRGNLPKGKALTRSRGGSENQNGSAPKLVFFPTFKTCDQAQRRRGRAGKHTGPAFQKPRVSEEVTKYTRDKKDN